MGDFPTTEEIFGMHELEAQYDFDPPPVAKRSTHPRSTITREQSTMAKGEKKFSTSGRESRRFTSEPFPAGTYDLKVLANKFSIAMPKPKLDQKTKEEIPGFAYIKGAFEALDTAEAGGRNRLVFHMFFLKLEPGSDGSLMVDRADQLVGFARALGLEIEASESKQNGKPVINAQEVLKWIQGQDGAIVSARVKIQKGDTNKDTGEKYSDKNVVEYFIEADDAAGPDADEDEDEEVDETDEVDADEDEDEEVDEDDEEVEEDDDEEVEEEEPAPVKRKSKAAPAPAAKAKKTRR